MLAGDGLETEGLCARGVGKCARGEDIRSNDLGANVLVERMRKYCRYIRSNPWSVLLARDRGLSRARGVGNGDQGIPRGEDA